MRDERNYASMNKVKRRPSEEFNGICVVTVIGDVGGGGVVAE